jgi:hypothetical protein
MSKLRWLFRFTLTTGVLFLVAAFFLSPRSIVTECPGRYVLHSSYNHDESQVLLVTMAQSPFG